MPNCPHCNSIYFGNPNACPDCHYNFALGRVVSEEELRKQREEEQARRAAAIKEQQEQLEREAAAQREAQLKAAMALQEQQQREKAIQAEKYKYLPMNARYEYRTEYLRDSVGGMLKKQILDDTLTAYANDGWRLHSVIVNESGKNAASTTVGGFTVGTNATMDVTILIFERCIKPAEY